MQPTSGTCYICLESFPENTKPIVKKEITAKDLALVTPDNRTPVQVKCGHVFHANCLHKWLETFRDKTTNPTCPNCRIHLMEPFNAPLSLIVPSSVNAMRHNNRNAHLTINGNSFLIHLSAGAGSIALIQDLLRVIGDMRNQTRVIRVEDERPSRALVSGNSQRTSDVQTRIAMTAMAILGAMCLVSLVVGVAAARYNRQRTASNAQPRLEGANSTNGPVSQNSAAERMCRHFPGVTSKLLAYLILGALWSYKQNGS